VITKNIFDEIKSCMEWGRYTKENYKAIGIATLSTVNNQTQITFEDQDLKECSIYDLMSGENFYKCVDCGGFIDYDGSIAEIFINGYISNLGLRHRGICDGGTFIVNGTNFKKICEEYKVEVNWANR